MRVTDATDSPPGKIAGLIIQEGVTAHEETHGISGLGESSRLTIVGATENKAPLKQRGEPCSGGESVDAENFSERG